MKRFVVAAVAALAIGLGSAGRADAQLVYGYSGPAGGGFVNNRTFLAPGGYQTYNNFYSPFYGTFAKQAYGADVLGNTYGRSFGYNPFTGAGYNTGFYRPNQFFNPFGGYSYGFYNRKLYPWW